MSWACVGKMLQVPGGAKGRVVSFHPYHLQHRGGSRAAWRGQSALPPTPQPGTAWQLGQGHGRGPKMNKNAQGQQCWSAKGWIQTPGYTLHSQIHPCGTLCLIAWAEPSWSGRLTFKKNLYLAIRKTNRLNRFSLVGSVPARRRNCPSSHNSTSAGILPHAVLKTRSREQSTSCIKRTLHLKSNN